MNQKPTEIDLHIQKIFELLDTRDNDNRELASQLFWTLYSEGEIEHKDKLLPVNVKAKLWGEDEDGSGHFYSPNEKLQISFELRENPHDTYLRVKFTPTYRGEIIKSDMDFHMSNIRSLSYHLSSRVGLAPNEIAFISIRYGKWDDTTYKMLGYMRNYMNAKSLAEKINMAIETEDVVFLDHYGLVKKYEWQGDELPQSASVGIMKKLKC